MSQRIREITATILDLPTRRTHGFATTTMARQSLVLVQVRAEDGIEGIGEGITPGGPWWSGESVETIKVMIDSYLAPAVVALPRPSPLPAMQAMDRCAAHNRFAKAAVEMALWDVLGKRAGLSLAELLGGTSHASLPITWALSADDSTAVAEEAEQKAEEGYLGFKFKMGAMPAEEDVARVRAIREKLSADIRTVVDPNGAWDEYTAGRSLQALGAAGIDIAEQPIAGWNIAGLARLRRCSTLRLMADESVQTTHDVTRVVRHHAADSVSLKIPKAGGVERAGAMADIAVAGGIALYGGSTLESSIGTAASAQLFATWPNLLGCELVGPLLLQEDIVTEPVQYKSGRLQVPVGPGLGVTLDEEKARLYARR